MPAAEFERFVVDELRAIARDRALVAATWAAWRQDAKSVDDEDETAGGTAVDQVAEEPLGLDGFAAALEALDRGWDRLAPLRQANLLRLIVRHVDYDGRAGRIAIRFNPGGILRLAEDPSLAEEIVT